METNKLQMSVYDMNKQIKAQNCDYLDYYQTMTMLYRYSDLWKKDGYYMILNKEKSYYTIIVNPGNNFEKFFSDVHNNFDIIDIEKSEDNEEVIEIWTKDKNTEEVSMYLFFNCDNFVMKY